MEEGQESPTPSTGENRIFTRESSRNHLFKMQVPLPPFDEIERATFLREIGLIESGQIPKNPELFVSHAIFHRQAAETASSQGIEIVFSSESELENTINDSSGVVEKYFGVTVSPQERQQLSEVIHLVPGYALQYSDGTWLDGTVAYEINPQTGEEDTIAAIIISVNFGDVTLEGEKLIIKPVNDIWKRKITHELAHVIKSLRSGNKAYLSLGKKINESVAATVEYISDAPPEKRDARAKAVLEKRVEWIPQPINLQLFSTLLAEHSTGKYREGVLTLIDIAKTAKISLVQLLSSYIDAGSKNQMAEIIAQKGQLDEETANKIRNLLGVAQAP